VEKLDLKLKSKLDLDSGESDTVVGDEITTHGEMTAGEMTPGETTAGETTAGETTPGETTPLETTPGGNGSELLDQMPPNADGQDTNVPMAMSDIGPPLSQDDLIFHCFVSALKGGKLHKDQLPMLTSAFFRGHMLVECPKSCRLDVKKTTYKKLSVFLQAMCDEGIIEVKEMSKGVDSITDVNTKHPMVKRYTPPETLSSFFDEEETLLKPSSAEKKGNGKISVVEMYMPSARSLPIFQHFGFNKSSILLPSQVREVLTDYIKREELACVHDKRMVRLGPVLTSLLHQKGVEDLEEMSWNELMKRFMSELRPAYKLMLANGEEFVRYCIVYSLEKALQKLITSFFVSKFPITGKYWLK
jgi:translation initiation factor 2D